MQVTLNFDAGQIGDSVVEMFANLSAEDKREISKQILHQWLNQPYEEERKAYKASLEERFTNRDNSWQRQRNIEEALNKYRSTREVLVAEITAAAIQHYKEEITAAVKADANVNKILGIILAHFKENMPTIIQQAVTAWFLQNMTQVANTILNLVTDVDHAKQMSNAINERLAAEGFRSH